MKHCALFSLLLSLAPLPMTHATESIYDIAVTDIEGREFTLDKYAGKTLLIVNTASKCGFTKQFSGLEELYGKYKDDGLVVLGFPCNQFLRQDPGTNGEIKKYCEINFGVTFPMFSKIKVNGPQRHPLYAFLAGDSSPFPGKIGWNFNKFLVGKDGAILNRYKSSVKPLSDEIVSDLEAALKDRWQSPSSKRKGRRR